MNTLMKSLVSLFVAGSLSAANITFSNYNTSTNADLLPIVTSSGAQIALGQGSAALGFFTDEAAAAAGDFTSFVEFGSTGFGTPAAFDTPSLFNAELGGNILSGSPFIGQPLTALITSGSEAIVAKSNSLVFDQDAPLFVETFIVGQDTTYLFGGQAGPSTDLGFGPLASIETSVVPETSSFALIAGILGFGWVMIGRRK